MEKADTFHIESYNYWIELIIYLMLVVIKILLGVFANSTALIADALFSVSEVSLSIIILFKLHLLRKLGTKGIGSHIFSKEISNVLKKIFLLCIFIIGFSYSLKLFENIKNNELLSIPNYLSLWGAIFSILVKEILFQHNRNIARIYHNSSIVAYGWHHRQGELISLLALLSISGAILGGKRLIWLDPLGGIIICLLIMVATIRRLYRYNFSTLSEIKAPINVLDQINNLTLAIQGVTKVGEIKAIKVGLDIFVEMVAEVEEDITSYEVDAIISKIKKIIMKYVDRVVNVEVILQAN
ncbi:MAG: cation diffusion facilitator family transporter [bacterium]